MSAPAPHCHGMDCCWSCFHGKPTHPAKPSDPDCERDGCEPDTRTQADEHEARRQRRIYADVRATRIERGE